RLLDVAVPLEGQLGAAAVSDVRRRQAAPVEGEVGPPPVVADDARPGTQTLEDVTDHPRVGAVPDLQGAQLRPGGLPLPRGGRVEPEEGPVLGTDVPGGAVVGVLQGD